MVPLSKVGDLMFYLVILLLIGFGLIAFGGKKAIKIGGLSTILFGFVLFIILSFAIPQNKSKNRTLYRKAYLNNLTVYETYGDEDVKVESISDVSDFDNLLVRIVYYETNSSGVNTKYNGEKVLLKKYYKLTGSNKREVLNEITKYKESPDDYLYAYIEYEEFEKDASELWFKFVWRKSANHSHWVVNLNNGATSAPDDYIETVDDGSTEVNPGLW